MKKAVVLIIIFIVLVFVSSAYAHPPSDIKITLDPQTKILQAVIIHNTSNPDSHYIKKVDIGLNGKEIIEHRISREDNKVSQAVSYLVPNVKGGDVLSVEAYCSISGKLKKGIKADLKK